MVRCATRQDPTSARPFETARPDLWSEGILTSARTVAAKSSSNPGLPSWTAASHSGKPTDSLLRLLLLPQWGWVPRKVESSPIVGMRVFAENLALRFAKGGGFAFALL